MPITTNIVSSNHAHVEVYSIKHYVLKFVGDSRQVGGSPLSSINKTDCHNITKTLLKVALNTTLSLTFLTKIDNKYKYLGVVYRYLLYLLSPCYASWHIGKGQVSFFLLCYWLFFLLCPRCSLFPLFHFLWCTSMLFLVFLFFFSLLVSILGLPLSCLQMV